MRVSIERGRPYGDENWVRETVRDLGLEPTVRPDGRPRKASQSATEATRSLRGFYPEVRFIDKLIASLFPSPTDSESIGDGGDKLITRIPSRDQIHRQTNCVPVSLPTVGCGPTIASGSMLTEMIRGKSIAECRELTAENLIKALDGMPPDKLHCPALAIGALKDALAHWPGPQKGPT